MTSRAAVAWLSNQLIANVNRKFDDDAPAVVYARLFKVVD